MTRTPTLTPTPTATTDTSLIDNLEDGDGVINQQLAGVGVNAGTWFTFSDAGCAASLNPAPGASVVPVNVADGFGGPSYVAQLTGSGCNNYGAGIGLNFLNTVGAGNIKQPYNASIHGFTGIRFEIRKTSASTVTSARVSMPSIHTEPSTDGGDCVSGAGVTCGDHFGSDITLSNTWQSVTVYFNQMTQKGYGTPETFDTTQLFGIQWQLNDTTGASLGLQVDNVSFINLPPPPTFTPTIVNTRLIDDLEDGNGQINTGLANTGGNAGYWFSYGDTGCSLQPVPGSTATPITVPDGPPPTGGTDLLMQVSGSGCNSFGGGIGFNFLGTLPGNIKQPYSIPNAFTGVRFDLRLSSTGTVGSVRYMLPSYGTEPSTAGGGCVAGAGVTCEDHFGADLIATGTWQAVTLFFATNLTQSGYGTPASLDLTQVYGMQWQIMDATGANIGIQVDNVMFVSDVPPPTATPNCYPIDNMEDNNNMINKVCTRGGAWYVFGDSMFTSGGPTNTWGTSTAYFYNGTLQWTTPSEAMTYKMSSPGAAGSNYCAQITGLVGASCGPPLYNTCPFVGMGFDMRDAGTGPKLPYDISSFTGIQYDVRFIDAGDGDTSGFRMKFPNHDTTYNCTACSNDFGRDIITNTYTQNAVWQTVQYPISSFTQQAGWGDQFATFDKTTVYSCQWQYTGGGYHYNVSVDNVMFY
jgi:hypothetical protein